jgi:Na+/phosphate symporter
VVEQMLESFNKVVMGELIQRAAVEVLRFEMGLVFRIVGDHAAAQACHRFGKMGELREERAVRRLDDDVDVLYTAIKLYLARMPKAPRRVGQRQRRGIQRAAVEVLRFEMGLVFRIVGDHAAAQAARSAAAG